MLVFEDLHWADTSTCALIESIAANVADLPILLIGTYRSDESDRNEAFARLLTDLLRLRLVDDLLLDRLELDHVGTLVAAYAGATPPQSVVSYIFEQTEGNPFFVEETCRYLAENNKLIDTSGDFVLPQDLADMAVPRNVLLVTEQRLKNLSDAFRNALTLAAVIGREFDFALLVAASEEAEDTLLDVVEAGLDRALLRDSSTERQARYVFEHELTRQTLLASLSFVRRQRMHRQIAIALETLDPSRIRDIGTHLYRAGQSADRPKTAGLLRQAGEQALASSGFDDALVQFDRAFEVLEPGDADGRAELHRNRAIAMRGLARIEDALGALASGMAITQDKAIRRQLLADRGQLYVDLFRGNEAKTDYTELLALATEDGDAPMRLVAREGISRSLYVLSLDTPGFAAEWLDAAENVVDLARELDDELCLTRSLAHLAWYTDYDHAYTDRAIAAVREALEIAKRLDNDEAIFAAHQRIGRFVGLTPDLQVMSAAELEEGLNRIRDPVAPKRAPLLDDVESIPSAAGLAPASTRAMRERKLPTRSVSLRSCMQPSEA